MLNNRIAELKTQVATLKTSVQSADQAVRTAPNDETRTTFALQYLRLSRELELKQQELELALAEERRCKDMERNPDAYHD